MILAESYQLKMQALLGEEYADYLRSMDAPRLYGLRVNTAKISVKEFEKIAPFPVKKIPYIPNGFFMMGRHINRRSILITLPVYITFRTRRR